MSGAGAVADLVRDYYADLRAGEPLAPYFRAKPTTVKYGISETLVGYEAVAEGLREQRRTTTDWAVESRGLTTGAREPTRADETGDEDRPACGWFADDVFMAWTDTDAGIRYEFDTRWSGTVVDGAFATMHVSVAESL